MVEVLDRTAEAAWKVRNLDDYDARLDRAVRRLEELEEGRRTAALVVYETALAKGGRPEEEVREMVRSFRETFEDEEEPLTIPRVSGILNVEGDGWFFGEAGLRTLAGRLLGQFQHRVAQYNYVEEAEVLRRWADGYDTRLFVRRRIHDTEPVAGVVGGLDLPMFQYLRTAAGGNTLVPNAEVARALEALGLGEGADPYETLARAEGLALHLELPAPLIGALLEDLGRESFADFPEPPRDEPATGPTTGSAPEPSATGDATAASGIASEGGPVAGGAAAEEREEKPGSEAREARRRLDEDPAKGDEPSRVQDPQAKDAPGVTQEAGQKKEPGAPEVGRGGASGTAGDAEEEEDG